MPKHFSAKSPDPRAAGIRPLDPIGWHHRGSTGPPDWRLHKEAAIAGADVATIPASGIRGLANHALTDKGLGQFARDWAATGQTIL